MAGALESIGDFGKWNEAHLPAGYNQQHLSSQDRGGAGREPGEENSGYSTAENAGPAETPRATLPSYSAGSGPPQGLGSSHR